MVITKHLSLIHYQAKAKDVEKIENQVFQALINVTEIELEFSSGTPCSDPYIEAVCGNKGQAELVDHRIAAIIRKNRGTILE